jgi:hypothetical protein
MRPQGGRGTGVQAKQRFGCLPDVQRRASEKGGRLMALPTRSPAHLAFIRSLPCIVCFRERNIEAAHVGRRGMGQKCSDLETLPLCSLHHREQHRIGLRQFQRSYELDIPELLAMLQEKPRLIVKPVPLKWPWGETIHEPHWFAVYRGECFRLFPKCNGLSESIALALHLCREYLIESYFRPARERRHFSHRVR